jgi:glycosyltransferase involved in cell wall biosynthesis
MRLLFITQKLKQQDAFGVLWVREFIRQGFDVTVICLEGSRESFEFPVHSLGKESGATRLQATLRFWRLIRREQYDRVFVHMSPVWYALGFWQWLMRGTPCYLWYTHYKMQLGVRFFGWFGKRFFCATPQSLPQYEGNPKKVVVGHGIDLSFWPKRRNLAMHSQKLLTVHRLSRSKRLEIVLRSLPLLDSKYTLDIYGIEAEKDYVVELQALVAELSLQSRVTFHGTVPMQKLPEIYVRYRLIMNMASETIDKTMLEAMTCGCYPVTTAANAEAIGIPAAPETDTPEAVAAFVRMYAEKPPIDDQEMYRIVKEHHGLEGLVRKMGEYMKKGD